MLVLEIFIYVVKFMKNYLFKNLEGCGIKVDDFKIIWVLIVFVIWDDFVKQFMRKVVEQVFVLQESYI